MIRLNGDADFFYTEKTSQCDDFQSLLCRRQLSDDIEQQIIAHSTEGIVPHETAKDWADKKIHCPSRKKSPNMRFFA